MESRFRSAPDGSETFQAVNPGHKPKLCGVHCLQQRARVFEISGSHGCLIEALAVALPSVGVEIRDRS